MLDLLTTAVIVRILFEITIGKLQPVRNPKSNNQPNNSDFVLTMVKKVEH